jgi:putative transposase
LHRFLRMPRGPRSIECDLIYHVLNRGNGRMRLFHKEEDFAAFEKVLGQGLSRYPVDLLTYCLMNNHWHLVLRPREDGAISNLMRWVGVTHVRRHHEHYHTRGGGHLYQGRFKSFVVEEDSHFLRLCRYVEGNALRAGMVEQAQHWLWCGLAARIGQLEKPFVLSEWPVDRPARWTAIVNQAMEKDDLETLRSCVRRGRPYGGREWVERIARRLGIEPTSRDRGRPRKVPTA